MQNKSEKFGVTLSNIPLINLRSRFNNDYRILTDKKFQAQCEDNSKGRGIETPYITWFRGTDGLFTYLVQQAIVGLEAYVPAATMFELGKRGMLSKEKR